MREESWGRKSFRRFVAPAKSVHRLVNFKAIAFAKTAAREWILALLDVRLDARKPSSIQIALQAHFQGQFPHRPVNGYDGR